MGPGKDELVRALRTAPRHIAVQLPYVSMNTQKICRYCLRLISGRLVDFDFAVAILGIEEIVEISTASKPSHEYDRLQRISLHSHRIV